MRSVLVWLGLGECFASKDEDLGETGSVCVVGEELEGGGGGRRGGFSLYDK